jgi:hypothetical protein
MYLIVTTARKDVTIMILILHMRNWGFEKFK